MNPAPWIILFSPLLAAAVIVIATQPLKKLSSYVSVAAGAFSLLFALMVFCRPYTDVSFTWIDLGVFQVRIGYLIDGFSKMMLLVVTGVGFLIHVYSIGYMHDDRGRSRYFAGLSLFMFSMLGIVLANNFIMMFIFWELVGVSSYILIAHWFERPSAADAANKALIVNRIGDFGFMLGILMVWSASGTVMFGELSSKWSTLGLGAGYATIAALMIFCGAVGKSAQFPLHVWLPDAMEGPTPVSALIHAATMVAAGVYLVARVYPVFSLGAINGVTTSLTVVVIIGVITALMAALIALGQFDIKRILAYSTVSQLGLMMVSLGVGGVAAGMIHLIAHGFFKALLFLGSGSVIHACHGEQDIRKMGGLRRIMPITFPTYAIGMMALSGVPFFFSGAWTKEEILHATALWHASHLPHYLMLAGVVLTALYMTRQMIYIFFGNSRTATEHVHESPRAMAMPLIVLALGAILLSVVLTPAWPWLHEYLTGEAVHFEIGRLIQPMLFVSLVLVGAGIGLGLWMYRKAGTQDGDRRAEIDPLEY